MIFKGEIEKINTIKKGMKISIFIPESEVIKAMQELHKYMNIPIEFGIREDVETIQEQQEEQENSITDEQRKIIYPLMLEIGNELGYEKEESKIILKKQFIEDTQNSKFSLSDCDRETAKQFIEYLIQFAIENEIRLKYEPLKYFDDIEKYKHICLQNKVCVICGKKADIHHIQAIGMGRNRNKVDDSNFEKMALCREHHTEIHKIGMSKFKEKYHI